MLKKLKNHLLSIYRKVYFWFVPYERIALAIYGVKLGAPISWRVRRHLRKQVRRVLSPMERAVLMRYFGLGPLGLREPLDTIGRDLGKSREWTRHINQRALLKLKAATFELSEREEIELGLFRDNQSLDLRASQ